MHTLLYETRGVDLTRIAGINESSALTILSEIGFSVAPWKTSKHFGKPGAVTATAHKLARLVYSLLKNGTEYIDKGVEHYEMQYKQRIRKNMKKRAKQFGLKLVETVDSVETDITMPSTN